MDMRADTRADTRADVATDTSVGIGADVRARRSLRNDEEGFVLVLVLMILLVVGALVMAAVTLGSNHLLISRYDARTSQLEVVAEGGLERGRALLNGVDSLYPDSGFTVLEDAVAVDDGTGGTIPGVSRSTYVGPLGITSGQYGIYGSVVSVAEDEGGGRAIRRLTVEQESFARFAYFTDVEPSNISFGGGDQIFGPVHTNDFLKIYSSGATFHDEARTAKTVQGAQYGDFRDGYEENVAEIPMPETADLLNLESRATAGSTSFTGSTTPGQGSATTRIEFMAVDLDGDGNATDEGEGFIRVYQSNDPGWVTGEVLSGNNAMRNSRNCGHYHPNGTFVVADDHPQGGGDNWVASLSNVRKRCFLGGADSLFNGFTPDDGAGQWLPWPGPAISQVSGRDDAGYLFPINRSLNPDFQGVVFVDGDVVISGTVRGRVTVAATGEIIIGDDITYATDPGLGSCSDLLGIFGGSSVVVADNALNAPFRPTGNGNNYFTYDDTKDEFIHGVVLTLDVFTVDNYASGADRAEACEGELWGRGCLYLTGGIIQQTRGAVGTIGWVGGTGYIKRYSYDACAAETPPPYFPTTGHFSRNQIYPVDPVGFTPAGYFDQFQAN